MKGTKTTLLALGTVGLLIGGSLVGAQVTGGAQSGGAGSGEVQSDSVQSNSAQSDTTPFLGRGRHGSGDFGSFGGRGFPFGRLALNTTVQVTFYDGDPAAGGTVTDTLDFTYGQDSEVAFAQALNEAQQNAQYVAVNVGEQTRTVDLSAVTLPDRGRGLLPRELAGARGLQDGGTLTATFYDGDPATGGQATDTLTFTYGTDSEAAFADNFTAAAENAAFVTLTTSPQTYTVNLADAQAQGSNTRGFDSFGFDSRGFDSSGFDQGRRGRR